MYCSNCGSQLPESAKFCPSCGMAQAAARITAISSCQAIASDTERKAKFLNPLPLLLTIISPLAILALCVLAVKAFNGKQSGNREDVPPPGFITSHEYFQKYGVCPTFNPSHPSPSKRWAWDGPPVDSYSDVNSGN